MPKRRPSKKSKTAAGSSQGNNRWGKNNGNAAADSNLKKENTIYAKVKFLSSDFEHDAEKGTAKYSAKYAFEQGHRRKTLNNENVAMILPPCLRECVGKMTAFGKQNGIETDGIGINFCSDQIPFGGKIFEPMDRNSTVDELVGQVMDKLANMKTEFKGGQQFEVIVNGRVQRAFDESIDDNESNNKENCAPQQEMLSPSKFQQLSIKEEVSDEEEYEEEEPGLKLLCENFELNLRTRTVKYAGTFKFVNCRHFVAMFAGGIKERLAAQRIPTIVVTQKNVPAAFNQCAKKVMAHAREHGITPNCFGFSFCSPQIPGGVYTLPPMANVDVYQMLGRIICAIYRESLAFEGVPYTMVITGRQHSD